MKEAVIEVPPELDETRERVADLHSLFNVLNVVSVSLEIAAHAAPQDLRAPVDRRMEEVGRLIADLRAGNSPPELPAVLRELETRVLADVAAVEDRMAPGEDRDDVRETLENLRSVFSILEVRIGELEQRADDPDRWVRMGAEEFRGLFEDVFLAIEKNARGRYRIVFNLARKEAGDYYIDLNVESSRGDGGLWVPLRLIDVLRDLTANARKYTAPGGKVALAVYQSAEEIRAVIEDSGCGIPEDELHRVVEFGYRAANVSHRQTMGGGFGLTKAALLITRWGGRIKIASGEGEGTRIAIRVPCATSQ